MAFYTKLRLVRHNKNLAENAGNQRIFYGWYVVLVSLLCRFMSTGVGFYAFNAFMDPLCKQKGWSRLDINLAPMMGNAVGVANMFVFGTLVMRVGPRRLMTIGPVISGLAFVCLGQTRTLWQFYAFFILMILGNGAMAGIVSDTVVNAWFDRGRGKALGLSTVGVSLSGAILPFIAMLIIESFDLEHAFIWIGLAITMIAPLSWAVIRDDPERYGMVPDGITVLPGGGLADEANIREGLVDDNVERLPINSMMPSQAWTFSRAIASPMFWKLSAAYAFAMMGVSGVMFQLAPRFQDIGYSRHGAMVLMSGAALVGAAGKYAWGALCDRFEPRKVVATLMAASAFGLALGLIKHSTVALMAFTFIYGFSMGGVVSTSPILIAHVFGRDVYPSIARFASAAINLYFISYPIMGWCFQRTGAYDAAYALFAVLYVIAFFLIRSIKAPSRTLP
jgi:MFS transporter, OFA family, oxalate/formate antiporter